MFPDIEVRISTPKELEAVLQEVRRLVADGTLRQIAPPNASVIAEDFSAVLYEIPWPDWFEVFFEDRSGRRYKLEAETYHGSGGSWGRA